MRIHHLALRTGQLAALERFYAGTLGLVVMPDRGDPGRSVWLDAGGAIVMIERREAGEPPVDSRAMDLACFSLAPEALAPLLERLAAAGVAVESRTAFSVYFRDPDGRRVGVSSWPAPLPP